MVCPKLRSRRIVAVLLAIAVLPALPGGTSAESDGGTAWTEAATSPSGAPVWGLGGSATTLVASTIGVGSYVSNDNGRTWFQADTDINEGEITFDPNDPDRGYYAGFGGLDRTTDAGATWTKLLTHSPVHRVAVADDGTVAASARLAGGNTHLFVSSDGGDSWTEFDSPIPNFSSVYAIVFGATSQDILMMNIGNTWVSADGGATWTQTTGGGRDLIRTEDGTLWQTGFSGMQRSTDGGHTWTAITVPDGVPSVLAARPGGGLFGASGNGVVVTTDNGATWTNMGYGDIAFAATALVADPENPDAVLMGDENMGVNRVFPASGGFGFEGRSGGFPVVSVTAFGGSPDGSILLAGSDLGLYASRDGGTVWSHTGAGLGFPSMTAVGATADGSAIFAGGRNWINGAYLQVSRDGGLTWDTSLPTPNDSTIAGFAAHPTDADVAWAAVWVDLAESFVLETTDGGLSWTSIYQSAEHIGDIAFHEATGSLLIGTDLGVFARRDGADLFLPVSVAPLGAYQVETAGGHIVGEGQGASVWRNQLDETLLTPYADTGDFLTTLTVAPDGRVWAGGAGGALLRCDATTPIVGTCVDDAPSDDVQVAWVDLSAGRVWVATDGSGLFHADL